MGITVNDLTPSQVTPITPPGKSAYYKVFQISATEVATPVVKMKLPAASSLVSVQAFPGTEGGTGDEVTITVTKGSQTISTGTFDLEASGEAGGTVAMSNLPNMQTSPPGLDITITTESTVSDGGPWVFLVEYIE